jgi:hypothetical protein
MAGKFCTGFAIDQYAPRVAKAFCEGRKAQVDGALKTTNPFTAGQEDENLAAWDNGWDAAAAADPPGCCAV